LFSKGRYSSPLPQPLPPPPPPPPPPPLHHTYTAAANRCLFSREKR